MTSLEVINMSANIATAIALLVAAGALFLNVKTTKLQSKSFQADLFHKITEGINSITAEQKEREEQGETAILNWFQRLINAFEYYAFFANRDYFTLDMETYYRSAVIEYINWAKDSEAEEFFKASTGQQLSEIRKYYEKHSGNQFPF